ncbi:MAG: hypothetical protein WC413_01220 [Candidatus Nanoarchaeia archaeon]
MEKPKIKGISSESYPGGRADSFIIEMQEHLQEPITKLFEILGFSKEKINDLDIHYPSTQGYFFVYSPKIKAHFFITKEEVFLVLDNKEDKEKLFKKIEEVFKIF